MSKTIRVLWPYATYDFGNNLPVVNSVATVVSDAEYDQIIEAQGLIPYKVRPGIKVLTGSDFEIPEDTIVATHGWVRDEVAGVVAAGGGRLPFHQTVPAATWTFIHNRNTKPDVVLVSDADGDERVYTDVSYPDDNTVVIEWPSPTTGWAYVL